MAKNYLELKLPDKEVAGLKMLCGDDCFDDLDGSTQISINELIKLRGSVGGMTGNLIYVLIDHDILRKKENADAKR